MGIRARPSFALLALFAGLALLPFLVSPVAADDPAPPRDQPVEASDATAHDTPTGALDVAARVLDGPADVGHPDSDSGASAEGPQALPAADGDADLVRVPEEGAQQEASVVPAPSDLSTGHVVTASDSDPGGEMDNPPSQVGDGDEQAPADDQQAPADAGNAGESDAADKQIVSAETHGDTPTGASGQQADIGGQPDQDPTVEHVEVRVADEEIISAQSHDASSGPPAEQVGVAGDPDQVGAAEHVEVGRGDEQHSTEQVKADGSGAPAEQVRVDGTSDDVGAAEHVEVGRGEEESSEHVKADVPSAIQPDIEEKSESDAHRIESGTSSTPPLENEDPVSTTLVQGSPERPATPAEPPIQSSGVSEENQEGTVVPGEEHTRPSEYVVTDGENQSGSSPDENTIVRSEEEDTEDASREGTQSDGDEESDDAPQPEGGVESDDATQPEGDDESDDATQPEGGDESDNGDEESAVDEDSKDDEDAGEAPEDQPEVVDEAEEEQAEKVLQSETQGPPIPDLHSSTTGISRNAVHVHGSSFVNSPGLKCEFAGAVIDLVEDAGEFISETEILCPLPLSVQKLSGKFYLRVSNDGRTYSNTHVFSLRLEEEQRQGMPVVRVLTIVGVVIGNLGIGYMIYLGCTRVVWPLLGKGEARQVRSKRGSPIFHRLPGSSS